ALPPDVRVHAQHVVRRNVLGDANHGLDAGVDGLVDRVGRETGRDEDQRRVRTRVLDGVGDGVEHRDALDVLAALPRSDPGDDLRAVVAVAQTVVATLAPVQALHDEPRFVVYADHHQWRIGCHWRL